ncbi:MAG TPA: hypothetical protein DCE42_05445 [Myxococcales bacterium]|nr:hypothetical protein [Myxococcales bacterium]
MRVFGWIWIGCMSGLLLTACQSREIPSTSSTPQLSAAKLLKTPVSALTPNQTTHTSHTHFKLPYVEHIQLHLRSKKGTLTRYFFTREEKSWWMVRMNEAEIAFGHAIEKAPLRGILSSLKSLKPAEVNEELSPQHTRQQIFFFARGRRFLLRAMKTPRETGLGAIHNGEWLLYHQGRLLQQDAAGPLTRAMSRLKRAIYRTRQKKGWLQLPANSMHMEPTLARELASQLSEQRIKLRRCFKKRRFPASIGPLKMHLTFSSDGKVSKLRIVSKPHKKHSVVWCVWWFAKRWKVKPFSNPTLEYNLSVPPGGP